MTTTVIDPAPRPSDLDGARLGVLDTGVPGSASFLDVLVARLQMRHFLAATTRLTRSGPSSVAPADQLQELAESCDVVVIGVTQGPDSAAATAADVARLEQMVVPCAVVATTETAAAVRQALVAEGYRDGQSVIELSSTPRSDPANLDELVEQTFRQVERALTASRTDQQDPEETGVTPRNGEVTCEC